MKIAGLLILLILTFILICNCSGINHEIRKVVKNQLLKYPESTLKDIYKSFFQDEYGPGHLLEDTVVARKYFDYELSRMKGKGDYQNEPCGLGKNFYRASMDQIIDGMVDANDYFTDFLESSSEFRQPDIEEWKKKWELILKGIRPLRNRIHNFDTDVIEISEMLEKGEYIMHHSKRYIELYDPHYRIMKFSGKE